MSPVVPHAESVSPPPVDDDAPGTPGLGSVGLTAQLKLHKLKGSYIVSEMTSDSTSEGNVDQADGRVEEVSYCVLFRESPNLSTPHSLL